MSSIPELSTDPRTAPGLAAQALPWVQLTRPRVEALVLVTAAPVFLAHGIPLSTAAPVLLGTALLAGACSTLNACIEHERDGRMARTRHRPLPSGRVPLRGAVVFGVGLLLAGLGMLWAFGGPLPVAIGVAAAAWYLGLYTAWLKPRSPQNIVVGGAAGGVAPLIAEASGGTVGGLGLALFLLIFVWTPPHFWAIALFRREEYARAGLPMMPLVVGDQPTRWRMLAYALLCLPVSLLPVWTGHLGVAYGGVALVAGGWFAWKVALSLRARSRRADRGVFVASIVYLSLLFVVMPVALLLA